MARVIFLNMPNPSNQVVHLLDGTTCWRVFLLVADKVNSLLQMSVSMARYSHGCATSLATVRIGRDGLFTKFLSLGDDVPLPEPWESLIGVVGARKFVAGPGIGIRAQRISD
ncbi:MAG: hypothetical protein P8J68_08150 [Arenicellaceae bacterium]|nr:hypothetical protein [Arenicellaceae bacterium]